MRQETTRTGTTRGLASRRSVLRTGALTVGGGLVGLLGTGASEDAEQGETETTARMYASDFYPDARFRVVSESLRYKPETPVQEGEAFLSDLYWNGYGTRIVAYSNTDERVLFFPPVDAEVRFGNAYRTGDIRSTDELPEGIVTMGFRPVDGA